MSNATEYLQHVYAVIEQRDPHQLEFLEAIHDFFQTMTPVFEQHPEYIEANILERLTEPERVFQFRVPWLDDAGHAQVSRGFRVQFNSAIGPYKGGLRLHPSVNLSINIIINVDTKGANSYDVNSQIKLIYNDGDANNNVERPNQETEYFDDNHLLWNFYDSTASDKLYTGQVNINRPFQGSVLAPRATVDIGANLDGNIVADKVYVNGETHRWDLQDHSDQETEYEKPIVIPGELPEEWLDKPNIENPDIPEVEEDIDPDTGGLIDPDENNGNEGEETGNTPDPEKPGT